MAELNWTEPALQDLDSIADYIALHDPRAARELVQRVFEHVAQLEAYPESGSHPAELRRSTKRYRQIVEPPCRVLYRYDAPTEKVFVLFVMRGEMRLRKTRLLKRDRENRDPKAPRQP
ncbi:MAG TPA: type II toxin-antitoxin system RelE/ParE family toxin [Chthoniobacteraceae bacterium]|jgi:plasmid stabilization system protein ParE|nr:type II toxin-antitoxin system RelE/ParE family toxin [Chthoniobacteraceae bacterium]